MDDSKAATVMLWVLWWAAEKAARWVAYSANQWVAMLAGCSDK